MHPVQRLPPKKSTAKRRRRVGEDDSMRRVTFLYAKATENKHKKLKSVSNQHMYVLQEIHSEVQGSGTTMAHGEWRCYLLCSVVIHISSAGWPVRSYLAVTVWPGARSKCTPLRSSLASSTDASASPNRYPGHLRFPAKPNGSNAYLGSCSILSALNRSGSNLHIILYIYSTCCYGNSKVYLQFLFIRKLSHN